MAVRSTAKGIAVENSLYVLEVDLVVTQIAFAFLLMPFERLYPLEWIVVLAFVHNFDPLS
jgi:hypothetical protein